MATRVEVIAVLPYHLDLPDGAYAVASAGRDLTIQEISLPAEVLTQVLYCFDSPDGLTEDAAQTVALREANRLQHLINPLLRWYRHVTGQPDVLEVTRGQISPFVFVLEGTCREWLVPAISYGTEVPPPAARESDVRSLAGRLRAGLATGNEPPVAELNLLDARHARSTGRFREAVLLAWSVIDSSVVQKFENLVDQKLANEWSEAREFLKGIEFGLRHKMTSGFRLLAGYSFAQDPRLWERISVSYRARNLIIHKGGSADEDDAKAAIEVAEQVLHTIMKSL